MEDYAYKILKKNEECCTAYIKLLFLKIQCSLFKKSSQKLFNPYYQKGLFRGIVRASPCKSSRTFNFEGFATRELSFKIKHLK